MNTLFAIIASILFVLLTPGTILSLPKRASKFTRLAVHTLIFGILLIVIVKVIRRFFGKSIENFKEGAMSTLAPNCKTSTGFTNKLGDALISKGLDQTNMKNIMTIYLQNVSRDICNNNKDPDYWKKKFPLNKDNKLDTETLQDIINNTNKNNFMQQLQKFVDECNKNVTNEKDKLIIGNISTTSPTQNFTTIEGVENALINDDKINNILSQTKAPDTTTKAPTTKAPTTKAPTTKAPTTKAPTTKAPTKNK